MRKWLNNDFLNEAFSAEEQERIVTVTNDNSYTVFKERGGSTLEETVKDKAARGTTSILTYDDCNHYDLFGDSISEPTDYVKRHFTNDFILMRYETFWVRCPSGNYLYKRDVSYGTSIEEDTADVDSIMPVRPAFWLKIK